MTRVFVLSPILLLFTLFSCMPYERGNEKGETLSYEKVDLKDISLRYTKKTLDSLRGRWNHYQVIGEFDSLINGTRPFLETAVERGDTMAILYSGVSIAQAYLVLGQVDSVGYYLDFVSRYYRENLNDARLGIVLNNVLGSAAVKLELDYKSALKYFGRSLDYAVEVQDYNNQIILLANIVNLFYIRSDRNGMEYALKAMAISENEEVAAFPKGLALVSVAQMMYLSGEYDNAMVLIDNADEIASVKKTSSLVSIIYLLYGDIYQIKGDLEESEQAYLKAMEYVQYTEPAIVSLIYLRFGKMCERSGNYEKAIALYQEGLGISYKYRNLEYRRELLRRLSDLYFLTGSQDSAIVYTMKYRRHLDSVSNDIRELEFNDMLLSYKQMEHDNEIKSAELALLKERRRSMLIAVVLFVVVLILVVCLYVYHRQKLMYRSLVSQHQNYMQRRELDAVMRDESSGPKVHEISAGNTADNNAVPENSSEKQLFLRIEKMMKDEKLFTRKDLSLDKMAEYLGTNRTYISKAINMYSGVSFYNYLDLYRIAEASKIISDSSDDVPFREVADSVGYNSVSVFHKAFQRETGCTPGRYRSEVRKIRCENVDN